jgi:hypothetical protein
MPPFLFSKAQAAITAQPLRHFTPANLWAIRFFIRSAQRLKKLPYVLAHRALAGDAHTIDGNR